MPKLYADYHVGMALRHLDRNEEAAKWLRPVLAWAERLGNASAIAQASEDLGETMIAEGKTADGLQLLLQAKTWYEAAGYREVNPEAVSALETRIEELKG